MRDGSLGVGVEGWPRVVARTRRGPILRPSPTSTGVFGLDLTAGCLHGCAYCHIQGSKTYPGADRIVFDPQSAWKLEAALDELGETVRRVVLSPLSDPLPPDRAVRAEAVRVAEILLERGLEIFVMTRGRIPRALIEVMAAHPGQATVAMGLVSLSKSIVRALEPRAASPRGRIRDLARLSAAGIEVEARLEPVIAGLIDTRENIVPLFCELARVGVGRVVAHHLFLNTAMAAPLADALAPLGWSERGRDDFSGGPVFTIGSAGTTKHYPRPVRQESLARLVAWGAESGLSVATGSSQNPDLPQAPARCQAPPRPVPKREPVAVGS